MEASKTITVKLPLLTTQDNRRKALHFSFLFIICSYSGTLHVLQVQKTRGREVDHIAGSLSMKLSLNDSFCSFFLNKEIKLQVKFKTVRV